MILKNNNINKIKTFISPKQLKNQLILTIKQKNSILNFRKKIYDILNHKNKKLLIICGPCSIHEIDGIIDYAKRLKQIAKKLSNKIFILMRAYLEKPRTTIGWKGLINDPYMDNSYKIESGLKISRSLLLELISMKIPLATETLDLNIAQYLNDLITWTAIGARTTESQIHREFVSGLSIPVGFKNGTDGNIDSAINAMYTSSHVHNFLGINQSGKLSIFQTKGNKNCHIILRGGKKPNYYYKDIQYCENVMQKHNLPKRIIIDCSHGNSNKNFLFQEKVAKSVIKQIQQGNQSIIGLMLESYINSGKQDIPSNKKDLKYGISITDACIDWKTTEKILKYIYSKL